VGVGWGVSVGETEVAVGEDMPVGVDAAEDDTGVDVDWLQAVNTP
jgi:hypothetical protein